MSHSWVRCVPQNDTDTPRSTEGTAMQRTRGPAATRAGVKRVTARHGRLRRALAIVALACAASAMIAGARRPRNTTRNMNRPTKSASRPTSTASRCSTCSACSRATPASRSPTDRRRARQPVVALHRTREHQRGPDHRARTPTPFTRYAWLSLKPQPIVLHVPVAGTLQRRADHDPVRGKHRQHR